MFKGVNHMKLSKETVAAFIQKSFNAMLTSERNYIVVTDFYFDQTTGQFTVKFENAVQFAKAEALTKRSSDKTDK